MATQMMTSLTVSGHLDSGKWDSDLYLTLQGEQSFLTASIFKAQQFPMSTTFYQNSLFTIGLKDCYTSQTCLHPMKDISRGQTRIIKQQQLQTSRATLYLATLTLYPALQNRHKSAEQTPRVASGPVTVNTNK